MTIANTPYRAGPLTPESDDATGLGSNGGIKVQQNGQLYFAMSTGCRKRCYIFGNESPSLRVVGDLLREIGGRR